LGLVQKSSEITPIAIGVVTFVGKINEVIALLIGGFLGMLWLHGGNKNNSPGNQTNLLIAGLSIGATWQATSVSAVSVPLWQLGWFFLKVGSVLFGGGYLLVAFLQGGLVEEYGWLTQQQLLDAIAIGQFTPGPVLSTATFIGYILAGMPGAIVATLGIFLPSFLFVAALNPLIPRLRASSWTRAFLDAVNVSAVALMVVTTLQLAVTTLTSAKPPYIDFLGLAIALTSSILATCYRINTAWLVLGGAVVGWIALFLGYVR
jgi:chromate transporter